MTTQAIENRAWICVASEPGILDAPNPGALRFGTASGDLIIIPPMPSWAPPRGVPLRHGKGIVAALEYWIAPFGNGVVAVLASERGAHWHNSAWTGEAQLLEEFLSSMRSNGRLIEAQEAIRRVVDAAIDRPPIAQTVTRLVDAYLDTALSRQAELAVELFGGGADAVARLWEDGFSQIIGGAHLLHEADRMSLRASLGDGEARTSEPTHRARLVREVAQAGSQCGLTLADLGEQKLLL